MIRRPPRSTRTDTLFPYTTLFRSIHVRISTQMAIHGPAGSTADPGIASFVQVQLKPHLSTKLQMRSEEHTSELQSLMRISYAVFCLKKKKKRALSNDNTHEKTHKNTNKHD